MCEEREQLVAYLYDEVDAGERRSVETHLSECETCREELRAFRGVRQDLLAWDVPPHESVWKPFVTARTQPVWRQVPAWSLAAAATLVFATGVAGGFAGRALATRMIEPPQAASVQAAPVQTVSASAMSPDTVRALETRLAELERSSSVKPVANTAGPAVSEAALTARLDGLIRDSEGRVNKKLSQQIWDIVRELNSQRSLDRATFEQRINETQAQINGAMLRVMNTTRSPEKEQ